MPGKRPLLNQAPGQRNDMDAAIESFVRGAFMDIDNCIPAQVISFDRVKNIAKVKLLIQVVTVGNAGIQRKPLAKIPCISFGCGTFHISFPLKEGSLGWIFAADRDITEFLRTLAEAKPTSGRIKTFADGLFIPDVFRKYVIDGEDSDAMVIQTTDGKTKVSIRKDNIKISAPVKVVVDTPDSEFTGNVTIAKKLTVNGAAALNSSLNVAGASTLKNATVNGVQVDKHNHANPEGGDTGPMK